MKIVGLITEYNPFHNGHLYHLHKSKEITNAQYSIAVMSGNYVQRGCPAYVDKWTRAKMALEAGVDMVIEIPTYYATASAEFFAYGAVRLLDSTGIIDTICFGSEEGSTSIIEEIAEILIDEPKLYKNLLKENLSKGLGFATSRTNALYNYMKNSLQLPLKEKEFQYFLSSPNNILGIEYVKWLKKLNSPIKTATIRRKTTGYHEQNISSPIASASGIRHAMDSGKTLDDIRHTIPESTYRNLKKANETTGTVHYNSYSSLIQYAISLLGKEKLKDIMEISEGLENRIIRCSHDHFTVSELIKSMNTKRYTNARLNRSLLYILLHITKERFHYFHNLGGPLYIKVLGIRKESECLFRLLKKEAQLPLITSMGRSLNKLPIHARQMIEDEIKFTDIYTIGFNNPANATKDFEFKQPFIVI